MTTGDHAGAGRLHIFANDELGRADVILTGDLDLATVPLLAQTLRDINADRDLVIDAESLTFVDSTGLGVFAAEHKRLEAHGRQLTIRNPTPALRHLFRLTSLDTVLSIEPVSDQGRR